MRITEIRPPDPVRGMRQRRTVGAQTANPFPGARAFEINEEKRFMGRAEETAEVSSLLLAQRLLVLYAPSGAGKSSLIRAGVVPRLIPSINPREDRPEPGPDRVDLVGIARVHPSAIGVPGDLPGPAKVPNIYVTAAIQSMTDERVPGDLTLHTYLAGREGATNRYGHPLPRLLIFDQFEEILEPYDRKDWLDSRNGFMVQLAEAINKDPELHVLLAIRDDHLATIERLMMALPEWLDARYRLDKLTIEAAEIAIREPAKASGRPFSDDLVAELRDQLLRRRIGGGDDESLPDEFVEPALLQVVCHRLWRRARADDDERIELSHLKKIGEVAGALGNHYDEAITGVAAYSPHLQRRIRRFFERQLITTHGTRQLVPIPPADDRTARIPNEVLATLVTDYNLLRIESRGGTTYWELVHDGFVEPIRSANRKVWDRRAEYLRWALLVGAMVVVFGLAWWIDLREEASQTMDTVEQYVTTLDPSVETPFPVPIGNRDGGTDLVIEVAFPEGASGDFELVVDDDPGPIAAALRNGALATYSLPRDGAYAVEITDLVLDDILGVGNILAVNVRTDVALIEVPAVVGLPSADAEQQLTDAGLIVTTIRSSCAPDVATPDGVVIRVLRQSTLADAGAETPLDDMPGLVAAGTNVILDVSSSDACAGAGPAD